MHGISPSILSDSRACGAAEVRETKICLSCLVEDGWALAAAANTHKCTHTCVKYAKKDENGKVLPGAECRFGYGENGKDVVPTSFVKNGRAIVYADGRLKIGSEEYDAGNSEASAAFVSEMARAKVARETATADGKEVDEEDDDFYVEVRRGNTHINSYNWAIQQSTRSNIDIKTTLGKGRDARGLVFYMLGYSTKSEQSVGILLSLYARVVDKMQDDDIDNISKGEVARKMVQSCLTKQLSGTELGAPAAVCKIMGWSDTIQSHQPVLCAVRPVCSWVHRNFALGDSLANIQDDDDGGVVVTASAGRLRTSVTAPMDYVHRCKPGEVDHDLHGMSYFTYTRQIRYEKRAPSVVQRACRENGDSDEDADSYDDHDDDTETDDDDTETDVTATMTGRTKAKSYSCVKRYDSSRQQVRRAVPAVLNIMCEPPLRESQPEVFCRLMMVLFKPFFVATDLLSSNSASWESAYDTMSATNWDPATLPLRTNVETMQKTKRAVAASRKRDHGFGGATMASEFGRDIDEDSGDEGDPVFFGSDDEDDGSDIKL